MDPAISRISKQINQGQLISDSSVNKAISEKPATINTTDSFKKSSRRDFFNRIKPRNLWEKPFKNVDNKDWQEFSEKALLLKESTNVLAYSTLALPYISVFGAVGALGLTAVSVAGLKSSKNQAEIADRAASAGWGIQTSLQMAVKAFKMGKTATKIAAGLGVVGGVLETGLGIKRVIDGKKTGDKEKIKIGLLDIATGVTWAVSSALIPPPLGSALFIGAALLKTGYMNKEKVKKSAVKIAGKIKGWVEKKINDPFKNIGVDIASTPAS
ncbi:MAG: hypothetical protein K8T10_19640 [Candidatus Eremiobacteraeota bacterium]|nr:hypothetical protein [Candidatus Eremiobacteraeota bacterium]